MFGRREHEHSAWHWDGYYEYCRCGASAGDKRDPVTGFRHIFFRDWNESDPRA